MYIRIHRLDNIRSFPYRIAFNFPPQILTTSEATDKQDCRNLIFARQLGNTFDLLSYEHDNTINDWVKHLLQILLLDNQAAVSDTRFFVVRDAGRYCT